MARKLVPVETREAKEILGQTLRIAATSSPLSASDHVKKLMGEDKEFGIRFDNFNEFMVALRAVVTEINARNPDIKVDFDSGGGMDLSLSFRFTLCANINKSQLE